MKSIKRISLILITVFSLGISTVVAQNPSFIVDWNPCEIQITGSQYYVQYAIYNTTTQSIEIGPTWYPTFFNQNELFGTIEIEGWDCNQNAEKPYLYLFVNVELRKDGVAYCSGSARSSLLTCEELYGNQTTLTVNMSNDF